MFNSWTEKDSKITQTLKHLNLMGNDEINEIGWSWMFRMISYLKALKFLSLSLCDLKDVKVA